MADLVVDVADAATPLLGAKPGMERGPSCCGCGASSLAWRLFHALCFLIGGTTFIAGTACLFLPGSDMAALSALLYTIGSCGFMLVDAQELLTFTDSTAALRVNIAASLIGSLLYIVGSVGFFPQLQLPEVGTWGFILGSAVIACSQLWKTHRIGSSAKGGFSLRKLVSEPEAFTAAGVELSAGLGAACFFVGTAMYEAGPLEGPASVLPLVLQVWVAGSVLFTLGGTFLAWRHFVMNTI